MAGAGRAGPGAVRRVLEGDRTRPLHLIGSSIGSWRLACLAQAAPLAALERMEEAHVEQRYPPRPPPSLVSATSECILGLGLGLGLAALTNLVSRRTLGLHMERVIFHSVGDTSPFAGLKDLPSVHLPLTRENLRPALLASRLAAGARREPEDGRRAVGPALHRAPRRARAAPLNPSHFRHLGEPSRK